MNKFCGKCGKENTKNATFCPYCGEKMVDEVVTTTTKGEVITQSSNSKLNGFALAGFILALASSSIGIWGIGTIPGILAIVFSSIALNTINRTGQRGRGFAVAGLIVGILATISGVFMSFIYLVGAFLE